MTPNPPTIAIVDDDEEIVESLRLALEHEGYHCVSAITGSLGLSLIKAVNPALAILDVNLPEMNGFKLARLLKFDTDFAHIPVLFLTARTGITDQDLGRKVRGDMYLKKPFEMDVLLQRVRILLGKKG